MQPKFTGIPKVLNNLVTLYSKKTSSVYVSFIYHEYKNFMYNRDRIEGDFSIDRNILVNIWKHLLTGLLSFSVHILIFQENKILLHH